MFDRGRDPNLIPLQCDVLLINPSSHQIPTVFVLPKQPLPPKLQANKSPTCCNHINLDMFLSWLYKALRFCSFKFFPQRRTSISTKTIHGSGPWIYPARQFNLTLCKRKQNVLKYEKFHAPPLALLFYSLSQTSNWDLSSLYVNALMANLLWNGANSMNYGWTSHFVKENTILLSEWSLFHYQSWKSPE